MLQEVSAKESPLGEAGVYAVAGKITGERSLFLPYSLYSPSAAREIAEQVIERWSADGRDGRGKASHRRRAGAGWIAEGLYARILKQRQPGSGGLRVTYAPEFLVGPVPGVAPAKPFRITPRKSRSLDVAFVMAVEDYVHKRGLDTDMLAELLSRVPSPDLFVALAYDKLYEGEDIDIQEIRERVSFGRFQQASD